MTTTAKLDAAGRRRSPATYPDYLAGRSPNNKGRRYPADPPRVEEITAVMRQAGDGPVGISEALALAEGDLEPGRGALLVRRGKGGRRREVGMDEWGWGQLRPWLEHRAGLPVGPLFCVLRGPTAGKAWSAPSVRTQFRRLAVRAGVRRRFAPHPGHANLGITSVYLEGIDAGEIVETVHGRRAPLIPAVTALVH